VVGRGGDGWPDGGRWRSGMVGVSPWPWVEGRVGGATWRLRRRMAQ
jgi:hypothetical protein